MLTESLGFKDACQAIVPFAAAEARAHLDAGPVWIERVADTLSGSPKIAGNVLGFPSRRGRSITPIYACLFPVPVIVLSIVDRCCCIAFGDRYMAPIATFSRTPLFAPWSQLRKFTCLFIAGRWRGVNQ